MTTRSRAQELRAAFDRAFAIPPTARPALEALLAIRIAGHPYALRMCDVVGLYVDRWVTALPDAPVGFAGIVGLRGAVIPVFDLGAVLGHTHDAPTRWLVLVDGGAIGYAFEAFEGQIHAPSEQLIVEPEHGRSRAHVRALLQNDDAVRPILEIASVVAATRASARASRQDEKG